MISILRFIEDTFDLKTLMLFVISSLFLIILDAGEYKREKLNKEYKRANFFGYFYIIIGLLFYIIASVINI